MGIGPTQPAWKAGALPLSYTRISATKGKTHYSMLENTIIIIAHCQQFQLKWWKKIEYSYFLWKFGVFCPALHILLLEVDMKKQDKKYKEKSTGMSALADGNMGDMQSFLFDPNGSWTGVPYYGFMGEDLIEPEQDVDDL